jgi:hypothetical protein
MQSVRRPDDVRNGDQTTAWRPRLSRNPLTGRVLPNMPAERVNRKPRHDATADRDEWPIALRPQRLSADVVASRACPNGGMLNGYSPLFPVRMRPRFRDITYHNPAASAAGEPGMAWYGGDLPKMSRPAPRLLPARRPTRCRGCRRQACHLPGLCRIGQRAHAASQSDSIGLRAPSSRRRRIASRYDMDGFEISPLPQHHLALLGQFQPGDKGRGPAGALQSGAARWLAGVWRLVWQ